MKAVLAGQTVLLVVSLVLVGWLWTRVAGLEHTVAELKSAPAGIAALRAEGRPRGKGPPAIEGRPADRERPTRPREALGAVREEAPVEAKIDDHLWSDEGRAVIDDVVSQRDQAEREKRRERFEKMGEVRRERTIQQLATDLDLDDAATAELRDTLVAYEQKRGELWRKLREDDNADPAALLDEREAAQASFEASLTAMLGADGAKTAMESMRGGRGGGPGF